MANSYTLEGNLPFTIPVQQKCSPPFASHHFFHECILVLVEWIFANRQDRYSVFSRKVENPNRKERGSSVPGQPFDER